MTPERWRVIKSLYHEARARSVGERSEFLAAACSGDDTLRREVETLLASPVSGFTDGGVIAFLAADGGRDAAHSKAVPSPNNVPNGPASSGDTEFPAGGSPPDRGLDASTFRHYRLLQKLGEGGMGEVWEAEQQQPVRRRVALKVIKAGMDSRRIIARFESERQALALMNHPNIARVFEAGETDKGRPFFAMELVDGVPVTHYCDTQRLTTDERLNLFLQICDGVQHAHHKGVIHRDIKPSNVLVRVQDQKPVPKIIDFGIAKAIAQPLTAKTMFTELGMVVGTPAYMSPEQAERTGLDVDTRTDVYSLGMLLYELLVGLLPFDACEFQHADLTELRRRIREDEPTKPSSRLTSLGETSTELAKRRRVDLRTLSRQLRGDLDWITLKALEKDRTRRYGSPSELAADIDRHLRDEPVLAGPPSVHYRVGKFVRRHRVGVAAASLVLAVIAVGTVATGYGLIRARRAEAAARQEAAKAGAVNQFLQDMLGAADPFESAARTTGPNVTVLQLLDDAAIKLEAGSLKEQPSVEAAVRRTLGVAYMSLANYPAAERQLQNALTISTQAAGDQDLDTADSLLRLGTLRAQQVRYSDAESLLRRALAIRRARLGETHLQTAEALDALAGSVFYAGNGKEAESLERQVLAIRRAQYGDEHRQVATSLHNLAIAVRHQGRATEAEALMRQAVTMRRKTLGSDDPNLANSLDIHGLMLRDLGRHAEAEPLFADALRILRKSVGNEHRAVANVLNNLAGTLRDQRKFAEAEPFYRESLAIDRKLLPAAHPILAFPLTGLGWVLTELGKAAEAEPVLREAVAIREKSLRLPGEWRLPYSRAVLGRALMGQKRFREAEPLMVDGYTAMAANKDTPPQWTREALQNVIALYEAWHAAVPNAGKAAAAAEWRSRLK